MKKEGSKEFQAYWYVAFSIFLPMCILNKGSYMPL